MGNLGGGDSPLVVQRWCWLGALVVDDSKDEVKVKLVFFEDEGDKLYWYWKGR